MSTKRMIFFLALAVVAGALLIFNYFLWDTQSEKKQSITQLQQQVISHQEENKALAQRNHELNEEVRNLQSPQSFYTYEEKAREDYGMIGQNETFFVLPDAEIKNIPNVPGLAQVTSQTVNLPTPEVSGEDHALNPPELVSPQPQQPKTIAVTPVVPSLQLESLQ